MAEEADESIWKPLYIEWEDSPEGRKGFGRKNDEGAAGRKQYEAGTTKEGRPPVLRTGGVSWGSDGRGKLPERAVELTSHFHERPAIAPGQFGRQPENGGEQGQVQA